ncbi:MAG TPA: DUF559 domain-containing protein, partial [Chloroflexota bacterium]
MVEVARQFRKAPTRAEALLWSALKGRRLDGVKFRRQQPIGSFVVDFCAPERRLVVEVTVRHTPRSKCWTASGRRSRSRWAYAFFDSPPARPRRTW